MIKKGVYAAGLSILNDDYSLDVSATIIHAESLLKKGLHGVFFLVQRDRVSSFLLEKKKT